MNVICFSKYDCLGASSRVRFYQYIDNFAKNGIYCHVSFLLSNSYIRKIYRGDKARGEIFTGYLKRFFEIMFLSRKRFPVIIIEKELFPYFPCFFERFLQIRGFRIVVDLDDAQFHIYDQHRWLMIRLLLGNKIDRILGCCDFAVVGNSYLAERANDARVKRLAVIPSVVDVRENVDKPNKLEDPIIGWIGTPKTEHYLKAIVCVFEDIIAMGIKARFVAIGASSETFEGTCVEVWDWSEKTEQSDISKFSIGIMPLADTPWEKGKCAYKLLQCMEAGKPVVASKIGANCDVVKHNWNGFLVNDNSEWLSYLVRLLNDYNLCETLGRNGRAQICEQFSVEFGVSRWLDIFDEFENDFND